MPFISFYTAPARQRIAFVVRPSFKRVSFLVTPEKKKLSFTTREKLHFLSFTVQPTKAYLNFTTRDRNKRYLSFKVAGERPSISFAVGRPIPSTALTYTIGKDGKTVKVYFNEGVEGTDYDLTATPFEGQAYAVVPEVSELGWAWKFVITQDTTVTLTLTTGSSGVVAERTILLNVAALRALATLAKKVDCCDDLYHQITYYNGLVITLFEEQDYATANAYLRILEDVAPCECDC